MNNRCFPRTPQGPPRNLKLYLAASLCLTMLCVCAGAAVITQQTIFPGAPGPAYPQSGVIQASDGNFYGTTATGGSGGQGTIFKVDGAGVLTAFYSFLAPGSSDIGGDPRGRLVQGRDGNLYGTTEYTTSSVQLGVIFKITLTGQYTVLHSFSGADGASPEAGLTLGNDGNFYGVTLGGIHVDGTVFRITPTGTFTV